MSQKFMNDEGVPAMRLHVLQSLPALLLVGAVCLTIFTIHLCVVV